MERVLYSFTDDFCPEKRDLTKKVKVRFELNRNSAELSLNILMNESALVFPGDNSLVSPDWGVLQTNIKSIKQTWLFLLLTYSS
jgi:hypothetical protein